MVVLLSSACSGDDGATTSTTTTTTTAAPVTSLAPGSTTTTTTTAVPTTTTATLDPSGEPTFPEYTIVARVAGEDGDTVVVLLDADSYESLTDIDLANVLADVADRFPPVFTAHVIDDAAAADAVLAENPSPEEQEVLDRHYFVRLEEGFRMVFTGEFSDVPIAILGS